MIGIPIEMPASCETCPMMGMRLLQTTKFCRIADEKKVGEALKVVKRRPKWCPLIDLDRQEDDLK